jgi:hypothetical protein
VFLLGLVFYLAGLLTGLRPARWYGSRVFGLGPAVFAWFGVYQFPEYWQALSMLVLAGVILGAAVWGCFKTGGSYVDQPWPGKAALSTACALASLILCGVAAILAADLLSRPQPEQYCLYQFTRDGVVYRVSKDGLGPVKIEDLSGRPLRDEKTGQALRREDLDKLTPASISTGVNFNHPHPSSRRDWRRWYCSSLRYFTAWQQTDKTLWYLTRAGRLEGYDGITRRRTADLELGKTAGSRFNWPEDFYQNAAPNAFSTDPRQPRLLASDEALYAVDAGMRTVKPLLSATDEDGLGGYAVDYDKHEVLVVTRSFIRLLNLEGGIELQTPAEPAWPLYSYITVFRLEPTNEFALRFDPTYRMNKQSAVKQPIQVKWVKGGGEMLRRQKLPLLPEREWDLRVENCCALIVPAVIRVSVERIVRENYDQEFTYSKWDALSLIPTVLGALAGWFLGRRLHSRLRDQAGWAAFNLVFGIPGLLAFLSVQEWPAKERCPQCKKLRRVDREHCEFCGGEFAPPAVNGTEIFEPAAAAGGASLGN